MLEHVLYSCLCEFVFAVICWVVSLRRKTFYSLYPGVLLVLLLMSEEYLRTPTNTSKPITIQLLFLIIH